MAYLLTAIGALLVFAALRDIFHTLWHPGGFGRLSQLAFRLTWRAAKLTTRRTKPTILAGPVGLQCAILLWAGLVTTGWALIYLPHMPDGFAFGSALEPEESSDLLAALYLSLVSLATLGLGEIVPLNPALRIAVPLEALVGFGLLTAAISWILQLYPALTRRRSLAKRLTLLASTRTPELVRHGDAYTVTRLLDSISEAVTHAEVDLLQYSETYYFSERDPTLSLAATLPYVFDLVEAGNDVESPKIRHSAAHLRKAVEDLAALLDRGYLKTGATATQVLASFAADHHHQRILSAS